MYSGWVSRAVADGVIRVFVVKDEAVDGGWTVQVYGHARSDVCAAVTALLNGLLGTLAWLGRRYPRELRLEVKRGRRK